MSNTHQELELELLRLESGSIGRSRSRERSTPGGQSETSTLFDETSSVSSRPADYGRNGSIGLHSSTTDGRAESRGTVMPLDTFFEDELDRLETTVRHLATALKESESEKADLVSELVSKTSSDGEKLTKLSSKVAELEAQNRFLEEELAAARCKSVPASPNRVFGLREVTSEEKKLEDVEKATNSFAEKEAPAQMQRRELEYIAREDKLYMWVQMRTTELKKVADLLARSQSRNADLTRFIYERLTGHTELPVAVVATDGAPRSRTKPAEARTKTTAPKTESLTRKTNPKSELSGTKASTVSVPTKIQPKQPSLTRFGKGEAVAGPKTLISKPVAGRKLVGADLQPNRVSGNDDHSKPQVPLLKLRGHRKSTF